MASLRKCIIQPALVAGAIALAMSHSPARAADETTQVDDLWIEGALSTTYTLNTQLNPFEIDTAVEDGVVTLRGEVESEVEKELAEQLALGIDGVTEVNNQLTVGESVMPDTGRGERGFAGIARDANITAKVKSQLLWNESTHGLDINVDTDNGRVMLQGEVETEAEAQLAVQIARNTQGVRAVESRLEITAEPRSAMNRFEQRAETTAGTLSDTWITTKVKSALLYNRDIDMAAFEVDTREGVVYLKGVAASPAQRDEAIAVTRGIRGVKDVEPDIEVLDNP